MTEVHSTYPFSVRWLEGRVGLASAPDAVPDFEVATPPQFGGPGGRWTPEHLFVGAATTCWMTTFLAYAERARLEVVAVEAAGEAIVERGEDGRVSIPRLVLRPKVTVIREEDRAPALKWIQKAEETCLIARAMRAVVELEPEVLVAAEALAGSSGD